MTQLFRRAHDHGVSALFTRWEYRASSRSGSKKGPADSAFLQGGRGELQRIISNYDNAFAVDNDPLINKKDQSNLSSVSASEQQSDEMEITALDQVHLRQGINLRRDERWAMV